MSLCEFDSAGKGDFTLILHFGLVTDEVNYNVFGSVLLDFLKPVSQRNKGLVARDVVCEEHAVRAPIKDSSYRLEGLLASRIPYLNLDHFAIHSEVKVSKFYADGNLVLLLELIVHYALHKATFSDTSVSYNDQFEQVVVLRESLVMDHII